MEAEFVDWKALVNNSQNESFKLDNLMKLYNKTINSMRSTCDKKKLNSIYTESLEQLLKIEKKPHQQYKNKKMPGSLLAEGDEEKFIPLVSAAASQIECLFRREYENKISDISGVRSKSKANRHDVRGKTKLS